MTNQKITELEAEVYSLKQIIAVNFIAICNVNEESVTYANAVKAKENPLQQILPQPNPRPKHANEEHSGPNKIKRLPCSNPNLE